MSWTTFWQLSSQRPASSEPPVPTLATSSQKLPYDCLEHVTQHASNSQATLAALVVVSRDMNHLAIPYLYRRVYIKDGDRRCAAFLSYIINNDALARRVESFTLDTILNTSVHGPLISALARMQNLQHLNILDLGELVRRDVSVLNVIETLRSLCSILLFISFTPPFLRLLDRLPAMQRIHVEFSGHSESDHHIPQLERLLLRSQDTLTHLVILGNYDFGRFLQGTSGARCRGVWTRMKQLSLSIDSWQSELGAVIVARAFPNLTWLSTNARLTNALAESDQLLFAQSLCLSWWREMPDKEFRSTFPRVVGTCTHLRHIGIILHQEVLVPALNTVFGVLNELKSDPLAPADLRYVSVSALKKKPDDYAFNAELIGNEVEIGNLFAAFPQLQAVVLALTETPSIWRCTAQASGETRRCSRDLLRRDVDIVHYLGDLDGDCD